MTYFRITILLSFLIASLLSYGQEDGAQLFDDDFLHEIRLYNVDTSSYINTKDYQLVSMSVDGELVDSIGMKRKGNISGYPETNKYGIKIKTNKYVKGKTYDGTKEWTLHMNYQDPTLLREKLTYDLCFDLGLYSLRTAFTTVYLNDTYWGVFTVVEGKDEMYKQVFDNRDMDAVESLDFGDMCYVDDNVDTYFIGDYFPKYQVENGNELTAQSRFVNMLELANNTDGEVYVDKVSEGFNVKDFMRYQALNVALMNFDSYIRFRGNQIYVFDTIVSKWQVTPWDFNASFGLWDTNNFSPEDYPFIPNAISQGCIAGKMMTVPEMKIYYLEAMCELRDKLSNADGYFEKIDEYADQIRDAVYQDTRKVISSQNFEEGLGYGYQNIFFEDVPGLREFIDARVSIIEDGLLAEGYTCSTSISDMPEFQMLVLPNPAKDFISAENHSNELTQYEIINSDGRLVSSSASVPNVIDISELPSGIYVLRLYTHNSVSASKFVKLD